MPPRKRAGPGTSAAGDADAVTATASDDYLSCTLKGKSGSIVDTLLGLAAILTMLSTWFCGVFFPLILGALWYFQLRTAFNLFLGVAVLLYVTPFEQSPAWTRFILKMSLFFKGGATMHVEPEVIEALEESASIWCLHPHGLLMFSFVLNGALRVYAGDEKHYLPGMLRGKGWRAGGVAEPLLWWLPFIRSFLQLTGCVTPAARESFKELLKSRIPFGLLPGGSEEIILNIKGRERIYLKKRKGFVKYSLQEGYTLVPGYAFGETDTYWTPSFPLAEGFRFWLMKVTKIIIPCTWGFFSPYLPLYNTSLDTVWGKPIKLPRIERPSQEDIDHWHSVYIDHIKGVFDRNKARFGYGDRELEIL